MSIISTYQSSPISLYGNLGGLSSNDLAVSTLVGTRFDTGDYREVTLVQVGASAIPSGVLVQAPATIGANHTNLSVSAAAAIGATTISATLGATLATANQYAGGIAVINAGPGIGQSLQIASNAAANASGVIVVTLADPLSVALVTTTSKLTLVLPQYGGNNGTNVATHGVIVSPTASTGATIGVTLYPLPASTATVPSYGWIVNKGAVACLNDAGTAVGLDIMPSSAVAGAFVTYVAATRNRVGTATVAGVTTTAQLVNIQL